MTDAPRVVALTDGRRATLLLTGRGGANALDLQTVRELDACSAHIAEHAAAGEIDVLTIRAEGRAFCVGGDLDEFASATDVPAHVTVMAGHAHRAIARLHALEIPVVARFHGAVAGGGIGLLLVADVVIATSAASLTAGYAAAGLSPDAGVSWALPRLVGSRRFLELMLTNRRVDAAELRSLGVVSEVVAADDLDQRVDAVVDGILRLPGDVVRENKRLATIDPQEALATRLDREARTISRLSGTPATREILDALVARDGRGPR